MMSKKLEEAINEQIKNEFFSGYLYLSMATQAEEMNLPGVAHWFQVQAKEEQEHGMKFYDFINDRGGRVLLKAIDQPETEFKNVLDMFEKTLEHEKLVTSMINNLYEVALKEKDYPAQIMLQWFIDEQVEEEKNASDIIATLKMIGEKGHGLHMLDRDLGKREED
ncbi:MAG TPA: ferritin [Candidatus Atribacteria bacterium]|nr:ferritin [Candidatus Atribacteria bacterium]HCU22657.1 ferritin [Candidatus Atribacteria bacterium]